jgi:hypothetical protein
MKYTADAPLPQVVPTGTTVGKERPAWVPDGPVVEPSPPHPKVSTNKGSATRLNFISASVRLDP